MPARNSGSQYHWQENQHQNTECDAYACQHVEGDGLTSNRLACLIIEVLLAKHTGCVFHNLGANQTAPPRP